jgi:hypothetical protein
MMRMTSRTEGHLFSSMDLRQMLASRRSKMLHEIEQMESNRFLNTAAADLASYLESKYQISPIAINSDPSNWVADEAECQIDVSGDPNRVFQRERRGPLCVPGQRISIEIPFEGDAELFHCGPSSRSSSVPEGLIADSVITLSWESPHDAPRDVRSEVDRQVRSIQQYIEWVNRDVASYNASLRPEASAAIDKRRNRLLENQGRLAQLGIPLKMRADAPKTYAVPSVRRKVTPQLPQATSAAYTPEPMLDEQLYDHILTVVQGMAHVMERSPSAFSKMDEEALRQHFLVQLNGQFEGQATGETFNAAGKTDILLRAGDRNIFIAECKFWRGPKEFGEAIDQLLGYASWRDSKTAILVFNRGTATSTVVQGVRAVAEKHPHYKRTLQWQHESGFRFVFRQPEDANREIIVSVVVFDVPN